MLIRCWGLVVVVILLSGCTTFRINQDRFEQDGLDWIGHVVVSDKKGGFDRSVLKDIVFTAAAALPDGYTCNNETYATELAFAECHIRFVVDQVRGAIEKRAANGEGKLKLVIFIHGGLNSRESALRRVQEHTPIIKADGYHPIFLNWHSGLRSTYLDEIRHVRAGRRTDLDSADRLDGALALVSTPFYLLADVVRAVGQAVPLWANQMALAAKSVKDPEDYTAKLINFQKVQDESKQLRQFIIIDNPSAKRTRVKKASLTALAAATAIPKALTVPAVSSVGLRSWQNQLRRSQAVMRRPEEFGRDFSSRREGPLSERQPRDSVLPNVREKTRYGEGVFALLMSSLGKALGDYNADQIEVTLIGHSMGAIIANNIIEVFGDSRGDVRLHFDNIVYMGAAASIRSVDTIVLNYLRQSHPRRPHFYNLMLHPTRDRFQQNQRGVSPRGSLLEWIDAFYENSDSDLDRTAGKFTNVARIVPILDELLTEPELKDKITLRVFGLGEGVPAEPAGPIKHGDFSKIGVADDDSREILPVTFKYWLPAFWREKSIKIDACRGQDPRFFVKRVRRANQQPFFEPVGPDALQNVVAAEDTMDCASVRDGRSAADAS